MAAIPIYKSKHGPVELAFVGGKNMMPVGLGPCSQCIDIQARHQEGNKCWGTFESDWYLQGDQSMKCVQNTNILTEFGGYYTNPQSNDVGVQDIADNPAAITATQGDISSTLRWPAQEPNNGVNVPSGSYRGAPPVFRGDNTGGGGGYVATSSVMAPTPMGGSSGGSSMPSLSFFSRPFL